MKIKHFITTCILAITAFGSLTGQILTPNYPTPAEPVTRGYNQSLLTVQIGFTSICNSDTVTIQMPQSISYVAGSVTRLPGTNANNIVEADITNLRTPRFEITGIDSAESITFTIAREAACGLAVNGKDSILVVGSCGTASETVGNVNSYNIFAPSLTLTPPTAITNAIIGTEETRTITVTNGGNGDADTVFFYVVYPNSGIENTDAMNQITANGTMFAPSSVSGDTLFYTIFGATIFGGDNLITNGESITITEPMRVLECNGETSYGAGWGVDGSTVCQWATGTGNVSMRGGVANIGAPSSFALAPGFVDKCTPFSIDYTVSNSGTGDDTAGGMYNVEIIHGYGPHNVPGLVTTVSSNVLDYTGGSINGNVVSTFDFSTRRARMALEDLFMTDPDGAGGLTDLDGDGFFDDLPRGESFTYRLNVTMNCNRPCGQDLIYYQGANLTYDEMCGDSAISNIRAYGILMYEASWAGTGYIPANISNGVPFRITLDEGHYINSSALSTANTRYRWKLVLPAGVSVSGTGSPTYGGVATTFTQVADTIYITSSSNSLRPGEIDLVFTCGSGGNVTFNYELDKINNIVTGCFCQSKKVCASLISLAYCPAPCPSGPTNYVPKVERADGSLGWTNSTMATKQSRASISAYNLSKALYLDTIEVTGTGLQNSTVANLHQFMSITRTSADKLAALDASVRIIRGGVQIGSFTVSSATSTVNGSSQEFEWDLSSGISSLPGSTMQPNDSFVTVMRYVVSSNVTLPENDVQTGASYYHYSIIAGIREGCGNFIPEMYLVGTHIVDGRNAWRANGCAAVSDNNSNIARRFNTSGALFPGEYRPAFYIDSMVVTFPPTYTVSGNVSSSFAGSMTPNSINGRVYSYINPGTWGVVPLTVTNGYGGWVDYPMRPTCETNSTQTHNVKFYIKDYYYALADRATYPSTYTYSYATSHNDIANVPAGLSQGISFNPTTRPNFEIQNLIGDVVGALPQHSWDVEVRNTGINTGPYYWVALENAPSTGITIDSVINTSTGSPLAAMTYAGGSKRWYQVDAAGLVSSATNVVRIYFKYGSCNPDSILFKTGWDCSAFPSPDPDAGGACSTDSLWLKVIPANSQIQLSVIRQPGGGASHDLCANDSIILRVNSAQDGNVLDPEIDIDLPTGVTIGSPVRVEYPNGSGMYQVVTPTAITGGVKISLKDHTGIGANGINGLVANPMAPGRQARVIIPYLTDCDHISGANFGLRIFGDKPCGDPADGDDLPSNTNGINITGATSPGGLGVTMTIPNDTFRCGVAQTLTLSTTPVIAGTQVGDTVFYTLPLGTSYAGNFVPGANCLTCTASSGPGALPGETIVKVKLHPGVASGLPIEYTFDVGVGNAGSCGDSRIEAEVRREIAPLMCSTLPAPSLCGRSTVIAGSGLKDIVVARAELSIPSYGAANNYPYGSPYKYLYWGTIMNTAPVPSGNTITINTYFDRNMNGQYDRLLDSFIQATTITGPVAAGSSLSFADSFTSTTQPPSPTRPLFSVIDTADGNCLCEGIAPSMFMNALPVDWLSISAKNIDNVNAMVSWSTAAEYNSLLFEVYRSTDGTTWKKVGEQNAAGTTQRISKYVHTDNIQTLSSGPIYYKIKQIDKNGSYGWSQVVETAKLVDGSNMQMLPNPASKEVTVTLNKVQAGNYILHIYDMTGRSVQHGKIEVAENQGILTLDLSSLPAGLYQVNVGSISQKLVIQK